jgi:DHA2 family multidrug resistance protein
MFAAPVAAKLTPVVDVRKLVFVGLAWMALISLIRAGATPEITFGQIAFLMLLMGAGLPLFFLPLNTLALSSIDEDETAAGAGLLSFVRTLSGAFAVSMVNTAWEDGATHNQAELSGVLNGAQGAIEALMATGQSQMQALQNVTSLVQSQAVLLSTNQLMMAAAALFAVSAAAIWLAPRPARVADATAAH